MRTMITTCSEQRNFVGKVGDDRVNTPDLDKAREAAKGVLHCEPVTSGSMLDEEAEAVIRDRLKANKKVWKQGIDSLARLILSERAEEAERCAALLRQNNARYGSVEAASMEARAAILRRQAAEGGTK